MTKVKLEKFSLRRKTRVDRPCDGNEGIVRYTNMAHTHKEIISEIQISYC